MKRDCHVSVTRDVRVTSHPMSRDTCTRDVTALSRVSHATTTTPHHTKTVVTVSCGSSFKTFPSFIQTVTGQVG